MVDSEAYRTDNRLVQEAARKGYRALIDEYVYIDTADVIRLFSLVPGVTYRGGSQNLLSVGRHEFNPHNLALERTRCARRSPRR